MATEPRKAAEKAADKTEDKTDDTPQAVAEGVPAGLKGRHSPDDVGPNALQGDELLAAAQARAPSLTKEFVAAYNLSDDDLRKIARGEVPPPPTPGPIHTADLYLTPAGWQQTPPGVKPQDVGGDAIAR